MEVVGAVSSILSIVKSLIGMIDGIRCHPQRRHNLQVSVRFLVENLEVAEPHFDTAFADQMRREVEELKAMFEPFGAQSFFKNCMCICKTFLVNNAELDKAEVKLQSLTTRIILQLGLPRASNDTVEGPISKVGIDRSKSILEFLQQTRQNEPLRIICIRGQAGVGKTTLLNHIWEKVSLQSPFLARAYVRVGEKPSEESVCGSQSRILEQLGAGRLEFSASEFGRGDMVKHFKRLRSSNRPMIVAIDNVSDVQDLKNLLPRMTSDVVPSFSCIMLTCRDEKVVKALLNNICELREEHHSQVFKFTPKCLSPEESLVMFAETAKMRVADHRALLQEVVPLCGGLPLALSVLASIFKDEARRERKEWKQIVEGMTSEGLNSGHDEETSQPVMKSLQLSYDRLSPTHKAAFLDAATVYYDSAWEILERVVDAKVVKDLKDSSLLSHSDGFIGITDRILAGSLDSWSEFGEERRRPARVLMHDLTRKFGRSLVESLGAHSVDIFGTMASLEGRLRSLNPMDVRYLYLRVTAVPDQEDVNSVLLEFLSRAKNLQTLGLFNVISEPPIFQCHAVHDGRTLRNYSGSRQLRYMWLSGWKNSSLLMQTMPSSGIRQIYLQNCDDLLELPSIPLLQLECLRIEGCQNLRSFSKQCVEGWRNLKQLQVIECGNMKEVPDELGRLPELKYIDFRGCKNLEKFASLQCNPNGPIDLLLLDCDHLKILPSIYCQLGAFIVRNTPITSLNVDENAWKLVSVLELEGCDQLKVLPESIYRATALQSISLDRCKELRELPDGIEGLQSLRRLSLKKCRALERLPSPALGKCQSLIELDVSGCKKLKQLPAGIGNALSLKKLFASGCENLVELPDELTNLSLTHLEVSFSSNLEQFMRRSAARRQDFVLLNSLRCLSVCELPKLDDTWKFALGMRGCGDSSDIPDNLVAGLTELRLSSSRRLVVNPEMLGMMGGKLVEIDWFLESKSSSFAESDGDSSFAESDCDPEVGLCANLYVKLFELPNQIEKQQLPDGLEELIDAFSTELKRLNKDLPISRSLDMDKLSIWEGKIPKIRLAHLPLCSVEISIKRYCDALPEIGLRHSIVYSSTTAGKDGLSRWPRKRNTIGNNYIV